MAESDNPSSTPASTPARSRTPARAAEPASPSAAPQGSIVSRLIALTEQTKSVIQVIRSAPAGEPLTPQEEEAVLQVRGFIPKLARCVADMMEFAPMLFLGFLFTGAQLRAEEEETRVIQELLSVFSQAVAEISAYFAARKSRLARWTLMGVDQVQGYKKMAVVPAELQEPLKTVSSPIDDILSQANSNVQDTKKVHADLVQKGDHKAATVTADLLAAKLETQVLRGQPLTSSAIVAAAPQPPSRKGKTTKSKSKAKSKSKPKAPVARSKKK